VARAALKRSDLGNTPDGRRLQGASRADTKILGISITNGLATVDFSKEVLKANVGASEKDWDQQ
jgi:hypothetical protein